jgi:hypothetical protein
MIRQKITLNILVHTSWRKLHATALCKWKTIKCSGRTFVQLVACGIHRLRSLCMHSETCFSHFMSSWTSHSLPLLSRSLILFHSMSVFCPGKAYLRACYHTSNHYPSSWIWHHEIVTSPFCKTCLTAGWKLHDAVEYDEKYMKYNNDYFSFTTEVDRRYRDSKGKRIWECTDDFICSTKYSRQSMKTMLSYSLYANMWMADGG